MKELTCNIQLTIKIHADYDYPLNEISKQLSHLFKNPYKMEWDGFDVMDLTAGINFENDKPTLMDDDITEV
jgi:hypothetical protein